MTPKASQAHNLSCDITKAHLTWILSWIPALVMFLWLVSTSEPLIRLLLISITDCLILATIVFRRKLSQAEDRLRRFNQGKGT